MLARQELERADENLRLAEARVAVGASIGLDAKQAEVERGRAEVELLKAENLLRTETLRLMEGIGIDVTDEVELTSAFNVFAPEWSREELVAAALDRHPQLRAQRAQERAAETNVKMARSQYLPSLDFSVGWSGYAREATDGDYLIQQYRDGINTQRDNCEFTNMLVTRLNPPLPTENCAAIVADPAREAEILANNNVFPFNMTREPWSASLRISLPIFNGFTRERQLETARVAAEDARLRLRAEELRIKTQVASAHQIGRAHV